MASGILPVTSIPGWPIPSPGVREGLDAALQAAGFSAAFVSPDGLHVADVATAQACLTAYSGSASQLAFNKNAVLDQLNAAYLGKFGVGFNYTGPDGVKRPFQIDATSQFNIDVQANASLGAMINSSALMTSTGSGLAAETWDANSYFIAADNSHMPTPTPQDMRAFALAVRGYVSQLILQNRTLKDQIAAATDMATLAAIDITSGWPANT